MEDVVVKMLAKEASLDTQEVRELLEVPPTEDMGDYAFPCFILSQKWKKGPGAIATELASTFSKNLPSEVNRVEAKGPYVNFFMDRSLFAHVVLRDSLKKGYGVVHLDSKRIALEYPGPNTNKALHVGHLRNIAIGEAVSRLSRFAGNTVHHVNIYNDRGILISKSMVAYERYAKGKTPKSEGVKGDRFVGDLYVRFSKEAQKNPKLEEEALAVLQKWEAGDAVVRALWKKMNSWAYSGMQETFDLFGLSQIEKNYFESELYLQGKEIVEKGIKKRIFSRKGDGSVIVDLETEGLGEKVLIRSDGTSIYITQDLYLAEKRLTDFKADASYYVVGSDQDYHFNVLFSILKRLGVKGDFRHISYGMVALPDGKMKSRTGSTVYADDLISETRSLAEARITARDDSVGKKELDRRALVVALAAIKYSLLKVDSKKQIVFNPQESLAFEGDTGPYILYSYARASSIVRKAESKKTASFANITESEFSLLKKISQFPDVVKSAYARLAPHLIANFAFTLAQTFNEFYHECPVLGGPKEGFRLALVESFRGTLKKSLDLLGIECLEEM